MESDKTFEKKQNFCTKTFLIFIFNSIPFQADGRLDVVYRFSFHALFRIFRRRDDCNAMLAYSQVVSVWKMAIILFGIFTSSNQPATNNRPFALFFYFIHKFLDVNLCWPSTAASSFYIPDLVSHETHRGRWFEFENETRHVFLAAKMT